MHKLVIAVTLLLPAHAAAQVVADTFTRADSTTLGTTEVGARAYEEWAWPGSGAYAADVMDIQGERMRATGGGIATEPSYAALYDMPFDLELRVRVTQLADDFDGATQSNCFVITMRASAAPGVTPTATTGLVSFGMDTLGRYFLNAREAASTTILASATPVGAPFTAADTDGDGVLESTEPVDFTFRLAGDSFRWFMNGNEGPAHTIPAGALTGVDPVVASAYLIGRSRCIGGGADLAIALDDLQVFEDLCPADPDKLDPGLCGCGVPETACVPDAGLPDATPPPDADPPDGPPTPDASPPSPDADTGGDDGGGCGCRASTGGAHGGAIAAALLVLAAFAFARRARRD